VIAFLFTKSCSPPPCFTFINLHNVTCLATKCSSISIQIEYELLFLPMEFTNYWSLIHKWTTSTNFILSNYLKILCCFLQHKCESCYSATVYIMLQCKRKWNCSVSCSWMIHTPLPWRIAIIIIHSGENFHRLEFTMFVCSICCCPPCMIRHFFTEIQIVSTKRVNVWLLIHILFWNTLWTNLVI
jgi:hypothetical protein